MNFDILIDDAYLTLFGDIKDPAFANKKVLSLINDYEDGHWRREKFDSFIWDNIALTALSARERASLAGKKLLYLESRSKKPTLNRQSRCNWSG
jgi:hypothetical protein